MKNDGDMHICESEAARLLPWLVAGRLQPADARRVDEHLATCPVCRADFDEQRQLRELIRAEETIEHAPQPGLQKLMTRIEELDRELPSVAPPGASAAVPPAGVPRWLVAAVIVQALGLGLLGGIVWRNAETAIPSAPYQTLASPAPSTDRAPRLRVVFAPDMTLADLASVLGPMHGTIVAGPSDAGAFTVAFPDDRAHAAALDAHVTRLRADPRVRFAEAVVTAAR
jgi:anti-sigma factor RsiW